MSLTKLVNYQVGDKVQKGQVVCIIEAMKLMNEIEVILDYDFSSLMCKLSLLLLAIYSFLNKKANMIG